MTTKIFGTDGVRGLANVAPMDSDTALQLGRAVAYSLRSGTHRHRVVIGKDTRLSGYMLETALASGITSMGADVMLVGPIPTPGVAFITRGMRADVGIVISGSHNNWRENGIKFFDRNGYKLWDTVESKIEETIVSNVTEKNRVSPEEIGRAIRVEDATGRYIQFLKGTFPNSMRLDGIKIVVDCANGAGYKVAPNVFEELGADVITIGDTPDGTNINLDCGSLHTENLCRKVKETGADCGIALDGDADRVIMCDETGHVLDGDVIMALCADFWLREERLKKQTLVATIMSNLALDHTLEKKGIRVVRGDVGDKYVVQAMREGGFNVGGEQSGHLVFLDHNTTGDGCLGALQVLEIMLKENKPLSLLKKILTPYPQVLQNIKVREKIDFKKIPEIDRAIASAEQELKTNGRLLLRYSGTEKIARIMVEGDDLKRIETIAQNLGGVIQNHLGI